MAANNKPDFRKDNLSALSDLFLQVLGLCQRTGMVKLGHAALDATKVRGQCLQAQGDELQPNERERGAVGGGGGGRVAAGPGGG